MPPKDMTHGPRSTSDHRGKVCVASANRKVKMLNILTFQTRQIYVCSMHPLAFLGSFAKLQLSVLVVLASKAFSLDIGENLPIVDE